MAGIGAFLAASLISSLISGAVSYVSNTANMKAQQYTNQQNIEAQKQVNQQNIEYSREFAQNNMQWRVEDLENAGLNPVLAAGTSGSAQPTAMSALQAKAPMLDLSGISSAITAMNNMMLSSYLMSQRNDIAAQNVGVGSERNQVFRERNSVLDKLYKRKGLSMNEALESSRHSPIMMNSKQLAEWRKQKESEMTPEEVADWNRIMKELNSYKKK